MTVVHTHIILLELQCTLPLFFHTLKFSYDVMSLSLGEMDPKERLARQRKLLQKKLGLDIGAAIGMDTEELFNDEDLDDTCQQSGLGAHGSKATAGSSSRNHLVGLILASWL